MTEEQAMQLAAVEDRSVIRTPDQLVPLIKEQLRLADEAAKEAARVEHSAARSRSATGRDREIARHYAACPATTIKAGFAYVRAAPAEAQATAGT